MKLDETSLLYRLSMLCETTLPKTGCDVLIRATFALFLMAVFAATCVFLGGAILVFQGLLFKMVTTWSWAAELPQTPGEALKLAMLGVPMLAAISLLGFAITHFFKSFPRLARLAGKGLKILAVSAYWAMISGIAAIVAGGLTHFLLGMEPAGARGSIEALAALAMAGAPVLVVAAAVAYVGTRLLKPLCLKIELPG